MLLTRDGWRAERGRRITFAATQRLFHRNERQLLETELVAFLYAHYQRFNY